MLNAGVLAFDSAGRIKTISPGAVVRFNGGTPTGELGSLQVSTEVPQQQLNGIGYRDAGELCVVVAAPVYFISGLPVAIDGAVCVSFDQTPASWVAGIPLDAAGRMCCATPVPPIALKAYSSAFSPSEFD